GAGGRGIFGSPRDGAERLEAPMSGAAAKSMEAEGRINFPWQKERGINIDDLAKMMPPPPPPGGEPAVTVRSDFRSTLFWQPDLVTDEDGTAHVKLKYADSLTSWKTTARVSTNANQFGIGNVTTRTKM